MSDPIDRDRRRLLGAGAIAVASARLGLYDPLVQRVMPAVDDLPATGELASLRTATAWLNSPALTAASLRLESCCPIYIWTYTCINWLRTLPYVRAWADRYKAHGLVTIGVHAARIHFRARPRERAA